MNTPNTTTTTTNTPNAAAADAGSIPASLKREPPKKYDFHPLADLFPMLEDKSAAFEALVDDIRERRQQEPVWLYEGKILDGRNRYLACQKLGREIQVKDYAGDDPIGFVLSANLHRRHLNESQRAMVAAKLTSLAVGANQHTKGQGTSIDVASKLLNVGRASIDRARKVLATCDPKLVAAVEQGNVSVSAAADQAANKDKSSTSGKKGNGKSRKDSPKTLKEQIEDFKAEWLDLSGWQKRHFVNWYQDELAKLLEEIEGLAGMVEEEEEAVEAQPSLS
jgi:ParB-like chromosome segregation protein Spo0J